MIEDPKGDKWRANMIILGARYDLLNVDTFKYLIECGADIHADEDYALRWSAQNGHLAIVKFLVKAGADIHACNNYALRLSAIHGHLDIIKFLVECGADIHIINDVILN